MVTTIHLGGIDSDCDKCRDVAMFEDERLEEYHSKYYEE